MPIICHQLTKQFGHTQVLNGINLEIVDGEYIALMGKSGAGKSTLLNIMAGLDRPSDGKIIYNGVELNKCNDARLAEYRLREFGFIFQFYNLIPELTLYENIVLPLELDRKKINNSEVAQLIDQLGLTDRQSSFPGTLSGGEQQRAAIARAVIHKPKVIFADEPTGNLDEETAMGFLELIREVRQRLNSTVVLVTHDAAVAASAERVIHIADGIILEAG